MLSQDDSYREAVAAHGQAIGRLAGAYEADPDLRDDLVQEIHLALWRSFAGFDERCSLRTWVYRVAHNAAASHVVRSKRRRATPLVSLDELAEAGEQTEVATGRDEGEAAEQSQILERMYALIQQLNPMDRQVILLYLEGMDAAGIGEITGISSGYVATKIHRIKAILAERFRNGGKHVQR